MPSDHVWIDPCKLMFSVFWDAAYSEQLRHSHNDDVFVGIAFFCVWKRADAESINARAYVSCALYAPHMVFTPISVVDPSGVMPTYLRFQSHKTLQE